VVCVVVVLIVVNNNNNNNNEAENDISLRDFGSSSEGE
jgi:hypothetical protein